MWIEGVTACENAPTHIIGLRGLREKSALLVPDKRANLELKLLLTTRLDCLLV